MKDAVLSTTRTVVTNPFPESPMIAQKQTSFQQSERILVVSAAVILIRKMRRYPQQNSRRTG
jgi:hypothetical protein